MNIEEYIESLGSRKASENNPVKGLGKSIQSKLKNILSQDPKIISHAHFPEGSIEQAKELKEQFRSKFNFEAPAELIGFYELFNGFELRINKGTPEFEEEEFEEEEESEYPKRLSNLFGEGILFFGEAVDSFESGGKTIIPPANLLFSEGNKPQDNYHYIDLYYFDYFSDFNQIMIGVKNKKVGLYQVKYGIGELQKIREDFKLYFKKILIRK